MIMLTIDEHFNEIQKAGQGLEQSSSFEIDRCGQTQKAMISSEKEEEFIAELIIDAGASGNEK